ncbi:hypothetical protein SEVIR_7G219250v4 [Setaria viridis]
MAPPQEPYSPNPCLKCFRNCTNQFLTPLADTTSNSEPLPFRIPGLRNLHRRIQLYANFHITYPYAFEFKTQINPTQQVLPLPPWKTSRIHCTGDLLDLEEDGLKIPHLYHLVLRDLELLAESMSSSPLRHQRLSHIMDSHAQMGDGESDFGTAELEIAQDAPGVAEALPELADVEDVGGGGADVATVRVTTDRDAGGGSAAPGADAGGGSAAPGADAGGASTEVVGAPDAGGGPRAWRRGVGGVEVGRGEAEDIGNDVVRVADLLVYLLQRLQIADPFDIPRLVILQRPQDFQHRLCFSNGTRPLDGHLDSQPMADGSLQHLRPLKGRDGAARAHGCGGGWVSLRRERLMEVGFSLRGSDLVGGVGRDW